MMLQATPPLEEQIVMHCENAYRSVTTFEETMRGNYMGHRSVVHLSFRRPNQFLIEGVTTDKSKFAVISDGSKTRVLVDGNWAAAPSVYSAVHRLMDRSGYAAVVVPELLQSGILADQTIPRPPRKVSRTTLGGRSVFQLSSTRGEPKTVWIDARSFFLLRSKAKMVVATPTPNPLVVVDYGLPRIDRPLSPAIFKIKKER